MTIHNPEIADLFNAYALLLEIKGANPFRIRAYRNAARTVENLPRDLADLVREGRDLTELPGIGTDLAQKLAGIVTAEKFPELDALKRQLPAALADLTEVPGLGPRRIKTLFTSLKIKSLEDLFSAAREGHLRELPGFGPKLEATILRGAEKHAAAPKRFRLVDAERVAEPLVEYLKGVPGVKQVVVAGSFRRRKETVGDLDILVTASPGADAIAVFTSYDEVAEVLSKGRTRASVKLKSSIQVDLRVVPARSYGAALLYFTGSKAHNIALRGMGLKKGLKLNEYGLFRKAVRIAGTSEDKVYDALGLPLIAPELRENEGEIEAALAGTLPRLVTAGDIKGDLHVHTRASDGDATIEAMVAAAKALGYEYVAITDHSKHMGITHGLDARRLRAQLREIARLNGRHRGIAILAGVEVDILPDGRLALLDDVLSELDVVVAAVHTKLDLPADAQTERVIRAMDNPHVHIIAHPFGRLIGERDPCALDFRKVLEAARERGCHLEVNAQPSRLDLSDAHCRLAKEVGVKLAISTDAHSPATLGYMRYGIDQARRGWVERGDVINTRSLEGLKAILKRP